MSERKTIYLCLAHMSEEGWEQKYVKEAFDTNWVVPMGPSVNAFEEELRKFLQRSPSFPTCLKIRGVFQREAILPQHFHNNFNFCES